MFCADVSGKTQTQSGAMRGNGGLEADLELFASAVSGRLVADWEIMLMMA
jgi:hypothetical protein